MAVRAFRGRARRPTRLDRPCPPPSLLLQAPPYYVLILRSLTVLEGLALQADPSFKVGRGASGRQPGGEGRRAAVGGRRRADPLPLPLQLLGATWPFLSKRLLTDPDPALRDALVGLVLDAPATAAAAAAPPPRFKWDTLDNLLSSAARSGGGLDGADLAALAKWALGADGAPSGDGAPARLRAAAAAEAARALDAMVAARVRAAVADAAGEAAAERVAPLSQGDADAAARGRALAAAAGPHLPPALAAVIGGGSGGPADVDPVAAARAALAAVAEVLATPAGRDAASALASELAARFAARTVKALLGPDAAPKRRASAFSREAR